MQMAAIKVQDFHRDVTVQNCQILKEREGIMYGRGVFHTCMSPIAITKPTRNYQREGTTHDLSRLSRPPVATQDRYIRLHLSTEHDDNIRLDG